MKNKRKAITLSIVAIITLITLIVGATYAYFQVAGDSSKSTDVNVTTYTSDLLTFEMGSDIAIYATQTSFGSGKGNATGSTFAKAMLTANSKTNKSTKRYFMYLNISENTFTYTQNEDTPELLLTVTDTNGNEITSITGLEHKTVTDAKGTSVSGFDITTKSGLVTLLNFREITASPTKTDEWNVTVTLVNYNANQNGNTEKSFNAKLMIQEEIIPLHESCDDNTLACHIAKLYTGTQGDNSIYYEDGTIEDGINDKSYRFAGGDYLLTEKATDAGYFFVEATTSNDYVGSVGKPAILRYSYSTFKLLYNNTEYATKELAMNQAVSDGYLTKDNIKNYVCFGSTETPCPAENLYRIIGLIDGKVKLIKNEVMTVEELGTDGACSGEDVAGCFWNKGKYEYNNTWSDSLLNKINLNTNFINYLGHEWSSKIATTTWKVGGINFEKTDGSTESYYQNEIINPDSSETSDNATTYDAKIGLIYASDFVLAKKPNEEEFKLYNYGFNWIRSSITLGWSITRVTPGDKYKFPATIGFEGANCFLTYEPLSWEANVVRAVFNLEPSVTYVGGTGTQSDPIIIN